MNTLSYANRVCSASCTAELFSCTISNNDLDATKPIRMISTFALCLLSLRGILFIALVELCFLFFELNRKRLYRFLLYL